MKNNKMTKYVVKDSFGNIVETFSSAFYHVASELEKQKIVWNAIDVRFVNYVNRQGMKKRFYPHGRLIKMNKYFYALNKYPNSHDLKMMETPIKMYDDLVLIKSQH